MRSMLRKVALGVMLFGLVTGPLFAQATAGINGRIVDQAGAVLPGVSITVTNAETGAVRDTVTNGDGLYSVPALDRGTYNVLATITGFAPSQKKGIALVIGSIITVDFQLGLAQIEESLTVSAQAPLVES